MNNQINIPFFNYSDIFKKDEELLYRYSEQEKNWV